MKKLMTSKVAALVALSMTLALAVVTCGPTPSRGRLLGTLELAYPVVLAGEHQSVTIAITNDSREEARIITLQEGLASGALELSLVDAEGNELPPAFDIERVPRNPEQTTGLAPGDTLTWPDISTEHLALDMSKPGRYKVLVRVPVDDDLLEFGQDLTVVAPREVAIREVIAVPLEKAPWASPGEEGRVEVACLGRKHWLFYRRIDEYGSVAVVRLAHLSPEPELSVEGGIERLHVRLVDAEGTPMVLCIDPQDGTQLDCEG